MKIPKYVVELIRRRMNYAAKAMDASVDLQTWLDAHNIEIEEYDSVGGSETFCNPHQSANRVMKAIIDKE